MRTTDVHSNSNQCRIQYFLNYYTQKNSILKPHPSHHDPQEIHPQRMKSRDLPIHRLPEQLFLSVIQTIRADEPPSRQTPEAKHLPPQSTRTRMHEHPESSSPTKPTTRHNPRHRIQPLIGITRTLTHTRKPSHSPSQNKQNTHSCVPHPCATPSHTVSSAPPNLHHRAAAMHNTPGCI